MSIKHAKLNILYSFLFPICTFNHHKNVVVYNGVSNLGIYEASLSSNITFDNTGGMATVDLIKDQKFQVCPSANYMSAIYDTYCPADGSYAFDFNFTMPNSLGWYTTGFTGVGHLSITDGAGDLLGYCNINAEMYPTSQSVSASGLEGPSAKNLLLLILGILALIAVSYMCFGMCGRQQRKRQDLYRPGYYREPESKLVRMLDCA